MAEGYFCHCILPALGIMNPAKATWASVINNLIRVSLVVCLTSWYSKNIFSTVRTSHMFHNMFFVEAYLKPPFNFAVISIGTLRHG